jgi:hypothetical protein
LISLITPGSRFLKSSNQKNHQLIPQFIVKLIIITKNIHSGYFKKSKEPTVLMKEPAKTHISRNYNRRVFDPPPTVFWYPDNTVGHMVKYFIVVGVKKVTPFYSGEKGKRKKVKLMMMLVWESSNNSKWGIWAVVDKTLPSLLATHTHTQSETSGAHSPTM